MHPAVRALCRGLPPDVVRDDVRQEIALAGLESPATPLLTRITRRLRRLRRAYGLDEMRAINMNHNPPADLTALYFRYVSAPATPREIAEAVAADSADKRDMIARFIAGQSSSAIAAECGIAAGTVRGYIRQAMLQAAKRIAGLPRYHGKGRPAGRGYGRRKADA